MSAIDNIKQTKFSSDIVQVKTGDGTMYVIIMEDDRGRPIAIQTTIGKAGSSVRAWCEALSCLASIILDKGGNLNDIIQELENITSDKQSQTGDRIPIRSGPEGFRYALEIYQRGKRKRAVRALFKV